MATEDGEDVQRAEKVTLKRKLTGPPRLLLGKTRTRSVGEERPEAQTDKDKMENTGGDESSPKYSAAAESNTAELTETTNMDEEVSSVVNIESSGGRCGAAGEEDDIRNRKANSNRWWRRFSPAAVCSRKQKMDVKKGLGKQQSDGSVPPEGVLQDRDAASLNNTEEENTEKVSKGKSRLNVRTWPMFKRFLTSSDGHRTHEQKRDFLEKDGDEPSMTFRKKLRKFFTRGGKSRSSGVPLENMEDLSMCEEAPCSSVAQVDAPTELHNDVTVGSLKVVTAEMSIQLTEEPAESPDETPKEEQRVCDISVTEADLMDAAGSDTIQTDSEVVEGPTDTNKDLKEAVSSGTEVALDADRLSAWTTSSQDASELHLEEKTDETTTHTLQPLTNGPSIRIELVPPDDITQEDEEEECWGNQNYLLLLLGFEPSERQLVQTARSLVRAAMNAAVDQLTREQQSDSDCVHREPPGCRDHA